MNTPLQNLKQLSKKVLGYKARILANQVLKDERFAYWSGSAKPIHHHYGDGGLVKHTWEVVNLCFVNKNALDIKDINEEELFLAALYHDIGKLYDYEPMNEGWQGTEHKRLIHHISRSAIIWSNNFERLPNMNKDLHDPVLHAILAHHGHREWGSPVAPKTQVAWLLHLCDGISARMDDYNRLDVVKI
jgi:3'-5' exoribonuclease